MLSLHCHPPPLRFLGDRPRHVFDFTVCGCDIRIILLHLIATSKQTRVINNPMLFSCWFNVADGTPSATLNQQENNIGAMRRVRQTPRRPGIEGSVLDLRPPGIEFRILCLEDSVISIISPSSGGSPGPV